MAKLTNKQKAFCQEYMVDLNATQAAIRAGYSKKTAKDIGCENLAKPAIADYIAKLMAKRAEKTEVTADYVLSGIKRLARRCMQEEVIKHRNGTALGFRFQPAAATKAYELLGRSIGMFVDRKEISGPDGEPIETSSSFEFVPVGGNEKD